ncbi:hypothetical protein EDD15DRAFT_2288562 [Pisolithus albus]|nr:hypothetical protein EDD15DRAFT_2288562 [Pisolithus albus]
MLDYMWTILAVLSLHASGKVRPESLAVGFLVRNSFATHLPLNSPNFISTDPSLQPESTSIEGGDISDGRS